MYNNKLEFILKPSSFNLHFSISFKYFTIEKFHIFMKHNSMRKTSQEQLDKNIATVLGHSVCA